MLTNKREALKPFKLLLNAIAAIISFSGSVQSSHNCRRSRDLNKNKCKCIKQKNYCMYHKTSDNALKS